MVLLEKYLREMSPVLSSGSSRSYNSSKLLTLFKRRVMFNGIAGDCNCKYKYKQNVQLKTNQCLMGGELIGILLSTPNDWQRFSGVLHCYNYIILNGNKSNKNGIV